MNRLKEKIKYYREKKNISKSKLAQEIGVSPSYITRLENGEKTSPSLGILIKLVNALDIPLDEIADDVDIDDFEDIIKILIDKKGETPKEKMIINHLLDKIYEIQANGGWTDTDGEIILNELSYLSKNTISSIDRLKYYISSKDYDVSKLNNDQLKDIDKKFTDILELEFYKLNK